ncbi:MAG: hypothetical protein HC927_03645 [Deltaproteobacteria bacterium]|nr:hypothetical protein [Deltaproteobacteria bacterium]
MRAPRLLLTLILPACLLACDEKPAGKQAEAFDLAKECDRLGELAKAEGLISPDLAPVKVETCKTDMAELEKVSPMAYEEQSKCLSKAKELRRGAGLRRAGDHEARELQEIAGR